MKFKTFKQQFHPLILSGTKQTTIRERALITPGEVFALRYWTGAAYRSPMGTLGTATCQSVREVVVAWSDCGRPIHLDDDLLSPEQADRVAVRDGFASAEDMVAFFFHSKALHKPMQLIDWGDSFCPVVVEARP